MRCNTVKTDEAKHYRVLAPTKTLLFNDLKKSLLIIFSQKNNLHTIYCKEDLCASASSTFSKNIRK